MTPKELMDYILTQMTAEQALLKLLESGLLQYDKLKFEEGKEVHPLIIISMAAMDLGWHFVLEKGDKHEQVRGLSVGTDEYMKDFLKKEVAT